MEKVVERAISISNPDGRKLWGFLTCPRPGQIKAPVIIMCHGFRKTMAERKFAELSWALAENGIASLGFDFTGCGRSHGDDVAILEKVKDLEAAYNFLVPLEQIDRSRIAVLGHSLGSLIAALFQAKQKSAKNLILLAPAVQQNELISLWYTAEERRAWKKQGYFDSPKGRIGVQYLNEAESIDWKKTVSDIKVPVLVIHGTDDKDVPCEYVKKLYRQFFCPKSILEVQGADHHFESRQGKEALIQSCLAWLQRF